MRLRRDNTRYYRLASDPHKQDESRESDPGSGRKAPRLGCKTPGPPHLPSRDLLSKRPLRAQGFQDQRGAPSQGEGAPRAGRCCSQEESSSLKAEQGTPRRDKGATPPVRGAPRPGEGPQIQGLLQPPEEGHRARETIPTPRRDPAGNAQEQGPPPGGPSGRGPWPGRPGPRAHSPSARPQAALTAARKRSISVFFLLSGSHITWHSRISPRPDRGSWDMAAAGTTGGPGTGRGGGGDGRGRVRAGRATERDRAAP